MTSEIFIVGFARSGTTILANILNSSRDICVLGEANLHFRWSMKEFVYSFNKQHRESGGQISRSTYLPRAWIGLTAREVLDELRKSFPVVGSKIAFPPFREHPDMPSQDIALDFHMQHFYNSRYIFSLREPISSCLSAAKLFPESSANDIVLAWIRSLVFQVLGSQVFPYHWFVPLEWMDSDMLPRLEGILETAFDATPTWLREPTEALSEKGRIDPRIHDFASRLVLAPDATLSRTDVLERALELYEQLVSWIDRDTLGLALPASASAVIDESMLAELRALTQQLSVAPTEHETPNILSSSDDLTNTAWVRGALNATCSVRGIDGAPPVFQLRERNDAAHKSIMQRYGGHIADPIVFSVDMKPQGRHKCALQINSEHGISFAIFDIKEHKVTTWHGSDSFVLLDAECQLQKGGWVHCRFSIKAAVVCKTMFFSIYLLNDDGNFDFPGVETKGVLIRSPQVSKIQWPLIWRGKGKAPPLNKGR